MAEDKESLKDRLMNSIKKQTMINGVKAMFKKFPQAIIILPFLKDSIDMAKAESDKYLGDADNIIVIARKKGITNVVVINGKKEFTLSTGLKIVQDKTDPAVTMIQPIDQYMDELNNSGIFDIITEEDNKKFKEMKEKGFEGLEKGFEGLGDMLKGSAQKMIEASENKTPIDQLTAEQIMQTATNEITEHTEVGEEENIPAPDTIPNTQS